MQDKSNEEFIYSQINYWKTYPNQPSWKSYSTNTLLNDAIYGIGISMSENYKYASGNLKFLKDLKDYLEKEISRLDSLK